MKPIKSGDKILAFFFDGNFAAGTNPLTAEQLALQVIALNHPAGKKLAPHSHQPRPRQTNRLVEFLLVISGLVKVDIYDGSVKFQSLELKPGQGVLINEGGLGIEIIEPARLLEFKNGPFLEDKVVIS